MIRLKIEITTIAQKPVALSEAEFRRRRCQPDYLAAICSEYNYVMSQPQFGSVDHFSKKENEGKNRYYDVFCWDSSRVRITPKNGDTDYIHANYVDHYETSRKYVATQGPLKATVDQFWQLVWEQNSRIIVMLTELQVAGEEKCAPYWNPYSKKQEVFQAGDLSIRTTEEVRNSGYVTTFFEVFNSTTEERRTIKHYQHLDWPERGIPFNGISFKDIILDVNFEHQKNLTAARNGPAVGPIMIHCSAGIGRTGTFIAVDSCIYELAKTGKVSVPENIMRIRQQRCLSVLTLDQYVFIYNVLYEFLALFDISSCVRRSFCAC